MSASAALRLLALPTVVLALCLSAISMCTRLLVSRGAGKGVVFVVSMRSVSSETVMRKYESIGGGGGECCVGWIDAAGVIRSSDDKI